MVVRYGGAERDDADRTDRLFHALADPTRRDIVRLVLGSEQSVSALAERYPMSFAAVQKHVAVLERAELVYKRRQGRQQLVRGDIEALRTVNRLLDQYEAGWRSRVDQMDQILAGSETKTGIDAVARVAPRRRTSKEEHS
ncbi:MAG TPA: metalloregulator ArsR/SmtB family transcription factor [Acidimicrobiales bacterium]|jgi:DNA-binding transcriptional ArsR family regulator|nr:metalloregulator ArsR/SmtB family transcription factor [Acidimicrobiales bacterium]